MMYEDLIIPPGLIPLESQPGKHRKGLKLLVYGGAKTGKSFFLASFPHPILAGYFGEPGIEPYLRPSLGDRVFNLNSPENYTLFIKAAEDNQKRVGSVVIDNVNLGWEDWMDYYEEKLGEIKGRHWKTVKGPWKVLLRKAMRLECHFGMSAWLKDILYQQQETAPGVVGDLQILVQDNPQVEKTVPYVPDLIFKTDIGRDRKHKPNGTHHVIFYGGRRPVSVPPTELFVGKTWTFRGDAPPESVWDSVVGTFYERWKEGAVDHLGVDAQEAESEGLELINIEQDETVGRLVRIINAQSDLKVLQMDVFPNQIQGEALRLSPERREILRAALAAKKKELTA